MALDYAKKMMRGNSEESTEETVTHKRNYKSWVTDRNRHGKTSVDVIADWLSVKENYFRYMKDFNSYSDVSNKNKCYQDIIKLLVETEHAHRKIDGVKQQCNELQAKYYSVLDEYTRPDVLFIKEEDHDIYWPDKYGKEKRLSELILKKCKYFYTLRPAILEWEHTHPETAALYERERKGKIKSHISNTQSRNEDSSNKQPKEENVSFESSGTKQPRVIAEVDDDDDDDDDADSLTTTLKNNALRSLNHGAVLKLDAKKDQIENHLQKEQIQPPPLHQERYTKAIASTKNTEQQQKEKDIMHEQHNKYNMQKEQELYIQQKEGHEQETYIQQQVYTECEEHQELDESNIKLNGHVETQTLPLVDLTTQSSNNNTNNCSSANTQTKKRRKKRLDAVEIANKRLKIKNRELSLEERKVALVERIIKLEERKFQAKKKKLKKERLLNEQPFQNEERKKEGFSLFKWCKNVFYLNKNN